jgi:hypothetical protein
MPRSAFAAILAAQIRKRNLSGPRAHSRSGVKIPCRLTRGVKLVIADDHKGLRAAAQRVFSATHQRCRVHWTRNILAHVGPKNRAAVAAMLKTIFAQENKAAAVEQWDEVADALRAKHPKLGELMDASREDVLAYMDFPKEHWPQIASTNPLERLNRGIKRRADSSGASRTMTQSSGWSARSCSNPATSGPSAAGTCHWKPSPASTRLTASGSPPWRPDQPRTSPEAGDPTPILGT